MANDGFNGTTLTFGGAQAPLNSLSFEDAAAEVQVTGSTDGLHAYEAGKSNPTVTFEVVGGSSAFNPGSTGAATITWFDGSSDALAKGVVISRSVAGSIDNPIMTTITIRPKR